MRLPKYRAWHIEKQHMYEVMDLRCMYGAARHAVLYDPDGNHLYAAYPDKCILMQFTGLHDKNGVEIYEGDVVKGMQYDNYFGEQPYEMTTPITVEIITEVTGYDSGGPDGSTTFSDLEVIGNIYENPELVPVKEV